MREEWVETTLGEVAQLTIGKTPPRAVSAYWTSDLANPFCTIADMTEWSVSPRREGVTSEAIEDGRAKRVPSGSLLMSFKLTIGRVGFAAVDLFPNEAIVWIEPAKEVDRRFLALWLDHLDLEEYAGRAVKGKTLNGPSLRAIPVAFPPLAEQRRIVDLIAAVDENIEAAVLARDNSSSALRAASAELVPWLEPTTPLGEVACIDAKLVDPTLPEHRDLPHVGIEKIVSAEGCLLELATVAEDGVTSGKFLFDEQHVVYSKIRPELRKAALPGFAGLCSADAYPLRAKAPLSPEYLLELVLSEGFSGRAIAKSGRTKMPKINRDELFSIAVEVPSEADQARAVQVLGSLRQVRSSLDHYTNRLRNARATLLADLLSGNHEIPESYEELLEDVA